MLEGLGRITEARTAFVAALKLSPSDVAVLKSAIRCARHQQDSDALETLHRDASALVVNDAALRSALLAESARFFELERKDVASATELYHRAFSEDPGSLSALSALKRLL